MITVRGFFKDINDNDILVEIQNNSEETRTVTINEEDSDIWFAGENPVTITQDVENEFQHILDKQCTINLLCNSYVGDLFFAENARDVTVTITKFITRGMLVRRFVMFYGYVEPVTFSQGFAHEIESFTLNCHDVLGTLEYLNYKDVTLSNYDEVKANAKNVSFKEILLDILDGYNVWYDQSKGVDSSSLTNVFSDLGIFETYMLGETYDDVWTKKDVLDEMLRYLNLHIVQDGSDMYIFDWETLSTLSETRWYSVRFNNYKVRQGYMIPLGKDDYAAADTTISISDVYNQIQVTDELESLQTVIVSPFDSDSLKTFYRYKTDYMSEYIMPAVKNSTENWTDFESLVSNGPVTKDGAKIYHWQIQPMYSTNWKLNIDSSTDVNSLVEFNDKGKAINAYKLPLYAKQHSLTPLILRAGSEEKKPATDDEPINNIDLTPYLFISLLGNGVDPLEFNNLDPSPGPEIIEQKAPLIEYLGKQSGATYTPVSSDDTNYLVFSGKLQFMPRVWECDRWVNVNSEVGSTIGNRFSCTTGRYGYETYTGEQDDYEHWYFMPVGSKNNDSGRYYTRKFYKDNNTSVLSGYDDIRIDYSDNPEYDPNDPENYPQYDFSATFASLQMPVADCGDTSLPYDYSCVGNGNTVDRIKKLPILECELIIGDKRCVETNMDEEGNSVFRWIDVSSGIPQSFIDDNGDPSTYLKKTMSLGINPAIGDKIIGQEHDIQNTVYQEYDLGDVFGTAIPIQESDRLSGAVTFRILGPINLTYNQITRRDPDFWHHTKWFQDSKSVLSLCESIIIKEFEAKIYTSGQGSSEDLGDNDLVYVSDEVDNYISKADDVTFKFITQLSSEEAWDKQLSPGIYQNAIINLKASKPISSIYNAVTQEVAKPEEHYVDQYFRIFSKPRVVMNTTLKINTGISFENLYQATGIEKDSYVLGISQDLKKNTATLKLKENFTEN